MKVPRRKLELIIGILIAVFLICRYNNQGGSQYLIDYIIPYQPFKVIAVVSLIIVAARLIAGKPKDYSKLFYDFSVRMFGDPTKRG